MAAARRQRCTALAAALLACAMLGAASGSPSRRSLAHAGHHEGGGTAAAGDEDTAPWGSVKVVNSCPYPVALKAGYTHDATLDGDHPCPSAVKDKDFEEMSACATDWVLVSPEETAVLEELPKGVWLFSAYVNASAPTYWLSHTADTPEAYLAPDTNFGGECVNEGEDGCTWWAVPQGLEKKDTQLVLTCPDYDPEAEPEAPEVSDVTIVNKCPAAVQVKFVYEMAEGDKGEGCVFNRWYGDEHRCVTDWQWFEPEEERFIGQTINPSWVYAARIADDTSYDLGAKAYGAFQGNNETLACPEEDPYGSDYACEWWAPKCHFCDLNATASEPLVITCKGYSVPLP